MILQSLCLSSPKFRMRPRIYIAVILVFIPIIYFATRIYYFVQLFKEHSGIAISQAEVALAYNTTKDVNDHDYKQRIPKIIHQVWHDWSSGDEADNQTMPGDWGVLREGCKKLNQDYEFKLWTTKSSRDFIAGSYPWFLDTYDDYKHPVQRVDTVRYFLMRHYGGIYMDLDNGCKANLNPTLYYPAFLMDGGRGVLNNNILGAAPNHPFWELLTSSLMHYDYNYLFPYITISYASGQWFETSIWEHYHSIVARATKGEEGVGEILVEYQEKNEIQDMRLFRMGMDERDGRDEEWVFFSQGRGGTWVKWDLAFFVWLGGHWKALIFLVCASVAGIIFGCVRFWGRRSRGYEKVKEDDDV